MKNQDKRARPNSTPQPRSDFNWPPKDEELAPSGIDANQSAHERLRAYFNWPPDDAGPAPATAEASGVTSEEPRSALNWPPVDDVAASPGVGGVPEPAGEAEGSFNWPPPDEPVPVPIVERMFQPSAPEVEPHPEDSVFVPAPIEAAAAIEVAAPTLDVEAAAVAESVVQAELDGITDGQWELEIARLQALIDGLTEKLEWRATGVIGNGQRLQH